MIYIIYFFLKAGYLDIKKNMIAVVGAGISGLSVAYELQNACEDVVLLDASERVGGLIRTSHSQGYTMECGPASVFADEAIEKYLKDVGLQDQFVYPDPKAGDKFIFKNGEYRKAPAGPKDVFLGDFLSVKSKLAILAELLKGRQSIPNESIGAFISRRFGKEIADYLLAPLVGGIYAGDPYQLLTEKTFPFLMHFEKEYGSIIKGFLKGSKPARKSIYLKGGLECLTQALKKKIRKIHLGTFVRSVEPVLGGYSLSILKDGEPSELFCSALVLAVPAYVASDLLGPHFPAYADAFCRVNYASVAKVFLGFDKERAKFPFKGYGALNPPVENRFALAALWTGSVYPDTAPRGKQLVTGYVGGILQEGHLNMCDSYLAARVAGELNEGFNASIQPELTEVVRLQHSIPQYDIAIREAQEAAAALAGEGIFISSNWTKGAGVADCIIQAKQVALQVAGRPEPVLV